jgi:cephalosporin-C deacetylase-like acetyl esterase
MQTEVEFQSGEDICRGVLLTPDEGEAPFPTIVMAGGWCYVKEIVMPHYAEHFVGAGFAVLMFDYRHLGASDGMPRQHIDPWRQIEDYRNALSFLETIPDVDADRIGVWGISYSGGHVLIIGAIDERVKFVISNIPVVDGWRNMRRSHGETRFRTLQDRILQDRRDRFANSDKAGNFPMSVADPARELSTWPYPEIERVFAQIKEAEAPLHEHYSTIDSTEMLLQYTVFPYLGRVTHMPLLMLVAEGDDITLWDMEIEAFNGLKTNRKELFVIPEASHMSLYSSKTRLEIAGAATVDWLERVVVA